MKLIKTTSPIYKCQLVFVCFFIGNLSVHAQEKSKSKLQEELEQFKKNANKEFQQYKDDRDKEFADLLKKQWSSFQLERSKEPAPVPKPPKQPETLPPAPKQVDADKIPSIQKPTLEIPKEEPNEAPVVITAPPANPLLLPLQKQINYYNISLPIHYEDKMSAHCNEINEQGVSNYWNTLSSSNYPKLIEEINALGNQLQLNDWGYYELVNAIAKNITQDENDQTLFCFFMLSHLKFDAKVAKQENRFILMVPFETTIYKKTYLSINNRNYYVMNGNAKGGIYTFKQSFSESNKPINLSMDKTIKLGNDYQTKEVYFKQFDKSIPVKFNKNLIAFYNELPMSDLSIFFSSSMDPSTLNSLTKVLMPLLENKNELEAVNIILNFVQKSFDYKTDIDQFGYEKFYFPEDIFYYPYSDCEDRAVLFSHLVKSLLKLEVVGLEYESHAACAVKFNATINGDALTYKGNKYIICDPTYIGASAGMEMPQFAKENPKVIEIK